MENSRFSKHHGPHPGGLAIIYLALLAASLAIRWNALFQIGSAIPLGLLTAALTSRLHFLGVNVTGVSIALFGGIAASIFLAFSGLCTWVLSQPGIVTGDLSAMRTLQLLAFGSGGMLFAVALGLFMAGISVPCLFGGYAPRWLAWLGLILGGIGELSVLGFVFPPFYFLLPLVRFPSVVWMVGIGFYLRRSS